LINILFNSSTAMLFDVLSVDPHIDYSADELAQRCNVQLNTLNENLSTLQTYQFIRKTENDRYCLENNEITNAYLLADIFCRRKNNDVIHSMFEKGKMR